jgi:hypothetical protein
MKYSFACRHNEAPERKKKIYAKGTRVAALVEFIPPKLQLSSSSTLLKQFF